MVFVCLNFLQTIYELLTDVLNQRSKTVLILYFVIICLKFKFVKMSTETSEPVANGDVQSAIERLQRVLSDNYLIAERLMSLRNPSKTDFDVILGEINATYKELVRAMSSAGAEPGAIVAVSHNKFEFDSRKDEWLNQIGAPTNGNISNSGSHLTSSKPPSISLHESRNSPSSRRGTRSTRSTCSTQLSVKRLEAQAKLQTAQLEAIQQKERVIDKKRKAALENEIEKRKADLENEIEEREVFRKIALAEVECQVWERNSIVTEPHKDSNLYQVSKTLPSWYNLTSSSKVLPNHNSVATHLLLPATDSQPNASQECPDTLLNKNNPTALVKTNPPLQQTCSKALLVDSNLDNLVHSQNLNIERPSSSRPPATKGVSFSQLPARSIATSRSVTYQPDDNFKTDLLMSTAEAKNIYSFKPCVQATLNPSTLVEPSFSANCDTTTSVGIQNRPSTSNFYPRTYPSDPPSTSFYNLLPNPYNEQGRNPYYPTAPVLFPATYDNLFLPRPEFPKFTGDPLEFKSFINNFETYVEPRVSDEKTLLCLLLQHCTKPVKNKIEHFSDHDEHCYTLAKQRLRREYGSPWIISDVCEQRLKKFATIKSSDAKELKLFSELLEKTSVIIRDIQNYTSLNSLDTLAELVSKLPYELKRRWVKRSVQIENSFGHLANFAHFVEFVRQEADEINSLFGLRSLGCTSSTRSRAKASYGVVTSRQSKTFHPKSNSANACWFCNCNSHKLLECKKFKECSAQERSSFVKSAKLCHKCLSSKHRTPECKRSNTCTIKGCTGTYHHTLLHWSKPEGTKVSETREVGTSTAAEVNTMTTCNLSNRNPSTSFQERDVYLCIVPVRVACNGNVITTYAFFDQGSTSSFCDQSLVEALGVTGTRESLQLKTITGSTKCYETLLCNLTISDLNNEVSFSLPNVRSIEKIPIQPNILPVKKDMSRLSHLSYIKFETLPNASINLLIGADFPEFFCVCSARKGPRGTPCAIETPVGWSLLGPSISPSHSNNCEVNFVCRTNEPVHETIERMWESELQVGTSVFDTPNSKEDRIAYETMQSSVSEVNDHYQLPLLWKAEGNCMLSNNLSLAQKRMFSLKRRLLNDDSLRQKYAEVINTYVTKNHARIVPQEKLEGKRNMTWYLPHHPVLNVHKPEKMRVVFDCAARYNGRSLNDALMSGPPLMNTLVGVLIRFREERIALVGDIEAMFHQVRVDPVHADALRFLWWKDGKLNEEPLIYQMLVHLFGATSSPSCANFCLRHTANEFGHLYYPTVSKVVHRNFYVDDCLISLPSVEEAVLVRTQLNEMLARRGFRLRKWIANNARLLDSIPIAERSTKADYSSDDSANQKVLGVQWIVKQDCFTFDINLPQKGCTRRGILSTVASLYDPLGFAAPVTLEAKALLQALCKQKLDWDEEIGEVELQRWLRWIEQLSGLNNIQVPRCFKSITFRSVASIELHHFADASSFAYGACSYLRLADDAGNISLSFIAGKSRLASIKSVSIPRLELTAAVLAIRLDEMIRKELDLPITSSFFWTDSTAVLYSIKNTTKRFPVFVANRLASIERGSNVNQWRHVPSKLNPADSASKGLEACSLDTVKWLKGPEFLLRSESE